MEKMCESSSGPPPSDPLIMINAFYSDGGKALLLIHQRGVGVTNAVGSVFLFLCRCIPEIITK